MERLRINAIIKRRQGEDVSECSASQQKSVEGTRRRAKRSKIKIELMIKVRAKQTG